MLTVDEITALAAEALDSALPIILFDNPRQRRLVILAMCTLACDILAAHLEQQLKKGSPDAQIPL